MNIDDLITGGSSSTSAKRRAKPKQNAATRKRPRNDKKSVDNDDDLVALGLGSSIRDADQYEESVLRDAELSGTPRLMATTANDQVQFGFPSLEGLAPSRSVHADMGNIRNVLANLRKGTHGSVRLLTNTKDCLKEQMLLALLQSASGDFEMGVFPQQEAKQEWKRRKLHRTQQQTPVIDVDTPNTIDCNNPKQQSSSNDTHSETAHSDETPEGRLEGIKKGTAQKKSVRFSADVKNPDRPKSLFTKKVLKLKPRRRRISMQERKRREGEATLETNYHDDEEEEEVTRDDIVKHLKQLRIERERRRKKRKQKWKDGTDSESEQEFEFTGKEESQSATSDTILPETAESSNSIPNDSIAVEQPDTACLVCPLCGEEIHVPELTTRVKTEEGADSVQADQDKSHRDAVLAQHMSLCQTQRRSGQRKRAESSTIPVSIPSRRRNSRLNYAEVESDDEHEFVPESQMAVSRIDNERDDDYKLVGDIDEEEELLDNDITMDEDDKEIVTGKPARSKPKTRRSSRTKSPRKSRRASRNYTSSRPPPLDDWYEDDYEDRVDEWIENGLEKMPIMTERDKNEIPPGEEEYDGGLIIPGWMNDRLFPYQRTGLQWMWELHRQQAGGILGDEMGLGKTIQVASYLGSMAASRKVKAILIISPATMLQHWLKELAKWSPGIRRILIHQSGDTSNPSILQSTMGQRKITSHLLNEASEWLKSSRRNRLYEIIDEADLDTRDPSSFCGTAYAFVTTFENVRRNEEIWTNHRWSYVVIDEAQKIRNPTADVTLVCKRLKTPHRLALSGTPIQNDLRELWSIFDFVFPGRLGTLPAFETEFGVPIKRGGYSNASPMQVQLAYRCALLLKDLINPYLLRRLKKDIKEVQRMPGKKEQVLFCRLSDQQRSMYEAFLRSDYVKKVFGGSAQLLGAITVMRKICNHPDLVSNPDDSSMDSFLHNDIWYSGEIRARQREKENRSRNGDSDDSEKEDDGDIGDEDDLMIQRSGKMEILAKILPLWKKQGHRVLIFCQWKKMLDIIMRFVVSRGWKFGRLDGNTNVASRQRLVDTFNSDESYFGMLCTTRTGGVGLNLVGADRIILYDPDWNPQTDAQARERAWRFGQKREVTVFRMICAGTVEEKIYQRQIFKTAISNSVLQNSKQRRLFTQKDLKDLFSLKADNGSIVSGAEGVTETSHLTKGDGYIDPDDEDATQTNQEDDGETMRTVLKSKGLAGIFDHDVVEGKSKDKRTSVREMEERAKKIAKDALRNLRQSVKEEEAFERGSRFGGMSTGSSSLLSSIANRNAEISNATSITSSEEMKQHTELLKNLHRFVRSSTPTTDQILTEFSSHASTLDPAIFRKLLKSIAVLHNGRWTLK